MQKDQRANQLLEWIQSDTAYNPAQLEMVSGDASFRRYFRFTEKNQNYIAVDAPPEYENNQAFTSIAQAYLKRELKVPAILGVDYQQGFMLLEDFGDCQFASKYEASDVRQYYQAALQNLPAIQAVTHTEYGDLPSFDDTLLDSEFELFNHWLLKVHLNLALSDADWSIIKSAQSYIRKVFKEQPQAGVHRDFHSRNLMLLNNSGAPTRDSIGIIDFQDAVIGPITYDAVSLLRDCYIVWSDDFVDQLIEELHHDFYRQYDLQEFKLWFDIVGVQRHIKASGIFCRLCYRDNKCGYLSDIPRTLQYIIDIGRRHQSTEAFAQLVEHKILPAILLQQAS
ncbi:MAG: phosphotransferase [Alteromonadaceae bacterium]|nr:phosphotransferase [Alteromonadaceae bacterium]